MPPSTTLKLAWARAGVTGNGYPEDRRSGTSFLLRHRRDKLGQSHRSRPGQRGWSEPSKPAVVVTVEAHSVGGPAPTVGGPLGYSVWSRNVNGDNTAWPG